MQLTKEERFALEKIFHGNTDFEKAIIDRLNSAKVVEREATGVGFFTTIKLSDHLPSNQGRIQWDWGFKHQALTHGGSFMASYEEPDLIQLEAVSHHGEWPSNFDANAFSES